MKPRNIIIGQKVSPEKIKRAKELRRNMTPAEKILWEYLRAKRFNNLKFRRQQIIEGFIVDFYCHSLGLVIEVDGEIHDSQKEYDTERDKILLAKDLHILRFTNQQVIENINLVLNAIAQKIEDIEDLRDLRQAQVESKDEPNISFEEVKQMFNLR
jgi:very-short-patch-repair endonuclease